MKSKGFIISLIVLLTIAIISLSVLMIKMIGGTYNFSFNHVISKEKVLDETYDVMDINIDSNYGNVYIKENKENKIKVVVYGDKKRTSAKVENNTLNIESKSKKCRGFCFNMKVTRIKVYVPADYKNKIVIDTDAGDTKADKFNNLVLDVKTKAGDIEADTLKRANIKTSAGDIEIEKANSLTCKTKAGDIKVGTINKYVNLSTKAGDIKINTLNITKNSKIKTEVGDIKIETTNDIYIDANTKVGDTNIGKNNRKSDLELKVKTKVGDIKVNK